MLRMRIAAAAGPPIPARTVWPVGYRRYGSLSANISSGAPRSKKIDDSWRITLDESCRSISLQIAKFVGPQSIRVISIPTLCHALLAPSWPFIHCTGAGSIDWHASHLFTTILISALSSSKVERPFDSKMLTLLVNAHDPLRIQAVRYGGTRLLQKLRSFPNTG